MMSVQPMQCIDDPIADIQFKKIEQVTFDSRIVKNTTFLYTLNSLERSEYMKRWG